VVGSFVSSTTRRLLFAAALIAYFLAGAALLTGKSWLGSPTALAGIPAGNLLAWILSMLPPFAVWLLVRHDALRRATATLVLMGVLWLPVSILLAGNVSLNFPGGGRSLAWFLYTGACQAVPIMLMTGWAVARLVGRRRAHRT
jgi:hypothetical protein